MRQTLLFVSVLLMVGCSAEVTPEPDSGSDAASDADRTDATVRCDTASDCDDGLYCNGTEACTGGVCAPGTATDCDDGIACTEDVCVEARRACESAAPDADDDGVTDATCRGTDGVPLGNDCDDGDATRYPGNTEVCDATGHDEDCSSATYGPMDADVDGHDDAACCNTGGACGDDCDDTNANVSPSDAEVCNGGDDDCDTMFDEELPTEGYRPDCDRDGYGDTSATPIVACAPPVATPTCASAGVWVTLGGDCADDDNGRNIGNPEVCNGIDDDCDSRVDDIIDGTVVCAAGQTRPCTNTCAVGGTQTCSDSCLGWDTCLAAEVCNGCDDDADGADDDGFECGRGTSSSCTVPTCGTTGTRVCSASCGWGSCAASESCNYCDDDGDGNFFEERPLASLTSNDRFSSCATMAGPGTSCDTEPTANGFDLWAELLDGTAVPQAGALWLDPSTWTQGWGPIEVDVELEVRAVTAGGAAEMPLGGWAIIIGHGGTIGVGTAQNRGIPTTIDGVAASWFWSNFALGSCPGSSNPPSAEDTFRHHRLIGGGIAGIPPTVGGDSCYSGDGIEGAALDFNGPATGIVRERMRLRYTPDDPTTVAVDEEQVQITASTPGVGGTLTRTYDPTNDLPVGTGPLRIGITAGTYTQTGFTGAPGITFGVPVRARARIFHQENNCCGPPTFTYPMTITRTSICP